MFGQSLTVLPMRRTLALLAAAAALLVAPGCLPAPTGPATLIIGDSNTVGAAWGKPAAWADQLSCSPSIWALGGYGVTAGTPYSSGEYLERDYAKILAGRTGDNVVILLGTNDAQWGVAPTTERLNAISGNMLSAGAASVRWMTIPPVASNATPQLKMYREAWVQKAQGTPHVVDATGALGPVLLAQHRKDTIHLNAAGHAALASYVEPLVC